MVSIRRLSVLVVSVAVLVVAGCSSDGGDDPDPSTTTTAATSSSPTAEPATTTSEPDLTTLDPGLDVEAAVTEAVLRGNQDFRECVQAPNDCDITILAETKVDPSLGRLEEYILYLRDAGFVVRPAEKPEYEELQIRLFELGSVPGTASMIVCEVDAGIMVEPDAAPDGSDIVVDDSETALVARKFLELGSDGQWRVADTEVLERFDSPEGCAG